ncbi:LuxR C-terminal-related transcriptional regulator [Porticoccaceae bacterium]|nr:LuxR C-terminal-related transcriptional regulator [Porticoccaceae bacterium]MDB2634892.1 LuxR C-terminal-related transcriptional regulator [Porticoccaceae bacterium]MDB2665056.1 LuxR C-terminal-related transcriptional regulator [Porticoccaceae bacterium]
MISSDQMMGCMDVMNACLKARSEEDIEDIWLDMQALCNIDGMMLSVAESFSVNDRKAYYVTYTHGIDDAWTSYYQDKAFGVIDPVVRYMEVTKDVFRWTQAYDHFGSEVKEFIHAAQNFGLFDGYSVGQTLHQITHTASLASVTIDPDHIDESQHLMIKQLLPHINEVLSRPGFLRSPSITKKELEALQWASYDKSYWEIGAIMGITERTVKFHFNNIFRKLRVHNREQAVRKGAILGLIQ